MTGTTGSQRAVHFPPQPAKPEQSDMAADLVIWGRMNRAVDHLKKQLLHMPSAELDYHGTLQTALTAAIGIEDDLRLLLKTFTERIRA